MSKEQRPFSVGVPTEIKQGERRVGLTPTSVKAIVDKGSTVFIQRGAGEGSGFTDKAYSQAGARIVSSADEAWNEDIVVKVKEPLGSEVERIRSGAMAEKILVTYLHLAGDQAKTLTEALMEGGATGIAYETISTYDSNGRSRTPCLEPMSAIAGALAVQKGAQMLESTNNGMGKSLGKIYGIENDPAEVVIIGGGFVGSSAAHTALGLEANVTILEANETRRNEILRDPQLQGARVLPSTTETLAENLQKADVAVGGIYIKGQRADRIVTADMLRNMKPKAVFVDVAIDQGGMTELSTPTSHEHPVIHLENEAELYCVTNMPALLPRDASNALSKTTKRYIVALASKGLDALNDDPALARGLNVYKGKIVDEKVAQAHGFPHHPNLFLPK